MTNNDRAKQGRAAYGIQERLFRLYLEAKANNLDVAADIKDVAESLSPVIAKSLRV